MSFWYNNGREPWRGIDTNSLWTIRELPTQLNRSYLMAFGFSKSIAFKRLVDNCISDGLRFYHRQTIVKLLYAYGFYNIHLRQTLKCRWYRSANIAWDTEKEWVDKREFNQSANRKFHTWHLSSGRPQCNVWISSGLVPGHCFPRNSKPAKNRQVDVFGLLILVGV